MSGPPFIWDEFAAERVPPQAMDLLWAEGWRHFGSRFYRYNVMLQASVLKTVVPLRIHLPDFQMSKSQRRIWRRNQDLSCHFVPATHSPETAAVFERHKARFTENAPETMLDFLSEEPASVPCLCLELQCRLENRLVAASFMDVGEGAASSVYGVFEPDFSGRSLGIYTMLNEITWAAQRGCQFLYPGYATLGRGPYDYKKQFAGLQGYDWTEQAWKLWQEFDDS